MAEAVGLRTGIERAFACRCQPFAVVSDSQFQRDPQCDAIQFAGRKWNELRWEDWSSFPDAVTEFVPDAFLYYLPSLLIVSAEQPERWLWPAETLIGNLDRSPVVEYWDDFFSARFLLLTKIECAAMQEWVLFVSGSSMYRHLADRALDTLTLLQERLQR